MKNQREAIADLALKAKEEESRPLDARLVMDSTGLLRVKFTDTIKNWEGQIQAGRSEPSDDCSKRSPKPLIIEIFAVRGQEPENDAEPAEMLLESWDVVSFD